MNLPTSKELSELLDAIQKNSRSKGKYIKVDDFAKWTDKLKKDFPIFNDSLSSCLAGVKNIMKEIFKWAQIGAPRITDSVQLRWFKSFLATILNSCKKALVFAKNILGHLYKEITASDVNYLSSLVIASIVCGVVGAVVILGIGLWAVAAKDMADSLTNQTSPLSKIIKKIKKKIGGEVFEIPEDFSAPPTQIPNITFAVTEASSVKENIDLIGAFLFALFFKAAVAEKFNDEIREKIRILSALWRPTYALLAFLTLLLYLGSGAASTIS